MSCPINDWPRAAPAGLLSNRYFPTDAPDLSGKVAIVVGGSRGVGEALSSALAQKGAEVHILSATPEHSDLAVEHIIAADPSARSRLHTHTLDLGTLSQVISTGQKLASSLPRLDMLYLIAGIGVGPWGLTNDKIGNHFAVNNLSQVALIDTLMPLIKKTAEGKKGKGLEEEWSTRIISMASELHRAAPSDVQFKDLHEMTEGCKDTDPTKLYGRSKLGNILLMRKLSHCLPASPPIMCFAIHPGTVATEQQKGATEAYGGLGKLLEMAAPVLFMSKEQGCESALWAGTSTKLLERKDEVQGRYFSEAEGKVDTETSQAMDDVLRENLWALCVKTLKEKADYEVTI